MSAASGRRGLDRREFCGLAASGLLGTTLIGRSHSSPPNENASGTGVRLPEVREGEDVFGYVARLRGRFDPPLYRQIIGAATNSKKATRSWALRPSTATPDAGPSVFWPTRVWAN